MQISKGSGCVTYNYNSVNSIDGIDYWEYFTTLHELIYLLSEEKINELREDTGENNLIIDSVDFNDIDNEGNLIKQLTLVNEGFLQT